MLLHDLKKIPIPIRREMHVFYIFKATVDNIVIERGKKRQCLLQFWFLLRTQEQKCILRTLQILGILR